MKKVYGVLLTVALVATMVIPGLAAPSPTAEVVEAASSIKVEVAGVAAEAAAPELAEEIMKVAAMPQVMVDLGVSPTAKLVAAMEFTYDGVIPAGGIQVPFTVSSAKAGDLVYVLHRTESGQWEKVGEAILGADLQVVATFHSFSPVAIMVADAATIAAPIVAPKTGE